MYCSRCGKKIQYINKEITSKEDSLLDDIQNLEDINAVALKVSNLEKIDFTDEELYLFVRENLSSLGETAFLKEIVFDYLYNKYDVTSDTIFLDKKIYLHEGICHG